ncbi:MAG: sulfite oxidase heme-binding subunit YedZ [Kordiimonas sp.]
MGITTAQLRRYGKPLVFGVMLIPAVWLTYNWWQAFQYQPHDLGFNPQETSNRFTGDWAMRILLISLALTPLSRIFRSPKPILFRRMVGLFAFFYASLHITSYVWLDMAFDWPELWADVTKRIYITVGMTAFVLLIPLAITSTKGWVKRIGARQWQKLHKVVYLVGLLVIVHFIMMRKGFQYEPLIYGGILALLLLLRVPAVRRFASLP